MSFFGRVFSYVANQLLVDTLANSRTFQRVAIKTDEALRQATVKGAEHTDKISSQATAFSKVFSDELKKGFDELSKKVPK
mmetsp:Transcript_1962/g.5777  ORF Transcript_1962/g.5777 Transcript_1962/m.5777 type:complete len:80 (-) Transcript_1962:339-578(-)|eukprot:CAMPEP_0117662908 /NCGR_PEP_ID=MMETSP0804-20121206/8301_1 /TAXON_ID=1074897 /ORGANISM="Tetraselmis astigmatica, Strain CCMP880" /LENGTH=79 /DNA_ID=CAMNT_0005469833 /DNA_START=305 /DNA_END=544 /DNA_ORIENTATION=-